MTTYTVQVEDEATLPTEQVKELFSRFKGIKLFKNGRALDNGYTPRSEEEVLESISQACKDIKSGDIYNQVISDEEFERELEKC
jgi:aspartate ammonia-lyase